MGRELRLSGSPLQVFLYKDVPRILNGRIQWWLLTRYPLPHRQSKPGSALRQYCLPGDLCIVLISLCHIWVWKSYIGALQVMERSVLSGFSFDLWIKVNMIQIWT